jgi:dephospho-CoA kinase
VVAIGCTGGIGSGKSTVAALLGRRGARLVDVDAISHAVTAPGAPGHRAVVARFGEEILGSDGSIDRGSLAAIVFADRTARRDLERIVHPLVLEVMQAQLALATKGEVVLCVLPLLAETGARDHWGLDGVLVVDAPEDLAVERLVRDRGMAEADARARIAAQADRFTRIALADYVIFNVGTLEELEAMTEGAWRWIERLGRRAGPPGANGVRR